MNFVDTAKSIVCSVIAVALAMSVAAVEALLPSRPDWLERVNQLVVHLRIIASGDQQAEEPVCGAPQSSEADSDSQPMAPAIDSDRLLMAYNQLWQFVHGVRSDGLSLDDKFCERVEQEWTVATLLSYMRNADRSLQEKAGASLESASTFLATATSDSDQPA